MLECKQLLLRVLCHWKYLWQSKSTSIFFTNDVMCLCYDVIYQAFPINKYWKSWGVDSPAWQLMLTCYYTAIHTTLRGWTCNVLLSDWANSSACFYASHEFIKTFKSFYFKMAQHITVQPVILLCFAPGFANIFTQIRPSFDNEITDAVSSSPGTDESLPQFLARVTLPFLDILSLLLLGLKDTSFCSLRLYAGIIYIQLWKINAKEPQRDLLQPDLIRKLRATTWVENLHICTWKGQRIPFQWVALVHFAHHIWHKYCDNERKKLNGWEGRVICVWLVYAIICKCFCCSWPWSTQGI